MIVFKTFLAGVVAVTTLVSLSDDYIWDRKIFNNNLEDRSLKEFI